MNDHKYMITPHMIESELSVLSGVPRSEIEFRRTYQIKKDYWCSEVIFMGKSYEIPLRTSDLCLSMNDFSSRVLKTFAETIKHIYLLKARKS